MKINTDPIRSVALLVALLAMLMMSFVSMAVVVRVDTVIGSFDINMREDVAPETVANFLNYVRDRDYDNMFFHRSAPNFIVQAGGFSFIGGEFLEVPEDPPVVNEFNLSNIRATVAMAKLGGNPNSATSQWFINLADNSANLDSQNGGFTAFGEITESDMAIADAIGDVDNAIPGVEIFIIEGDKTPPMSDTPFANAFTDLPALGFDPGLGIPIDPNGILFDPDSNLVLVNSMREVGADLVANPASLDFGLVVLGSSSQQTVTITNKGLEDLALQVDTTGTGDPGFSVSGNTCTVAIATDDACVITFEFSPQSVGNLSAGFTITSNDADRPSLTIQVAGEGVAALEPRIVLSPADTLTISDVTVGKSGVADVTVTNTGTAALTIDSVTIGGVSAGLFSQVNDCQTLAIDGNCTVTVTFTPVSDSSEAANLSITSNDPLQPIVSLDLVGEGLVPDADLPPSLVFGVVAVNAFATGPVALSNLGNGAMIVNSITLGGDNADEFLVEGFCDAEVPPGGQCTINLTFRPTSEGEKSATLTVNTNDPNEPNAVSLVAGTAMGSVDPAPQITTDPVFVEFDTVLTGVSLVQEVVISNKVGTSDLLIESVSVTGADTVDFSQTNNCTIVEPITGSCTVTVTFITDTVGDKSANLSVVSNDPSRPNIFISLTGTAEAVSGPDIALPSVVEFGDVGVGTQATERIALTSEGTEDLQIDSIGLSGVDSGEFSLSDDCPDILPPGEGCTLTVIFTPNKKGVKDAGVTVTSNDPDEGTKSVSISAVGANDSDGVSDEIEDGHPNKNIDGRGDGNDDGIADALQSNVTSLPDIFGNYVTVVSPDGTRLVDVRAIENPSPLNGPTGIGTEVRFDQGFFEYILKGVVEPVTVTLIFPVGTEITHYFKYIPFFPGQPPQWFPFIFDGLVGAEFVDNLVMLRLQDGSLGDADLEVNGTIVDPGGPALIVPLDLPSSSGNSGCSVSTRFVPIQESAGWWLVFGLIGWLGVVRRKKGTGAMFSREGRVSP